MSCRRAASQGQPESWVWAGLVGCPARLCGTNPHVEGGWFGTSVPGVQSGWAVGSPPAVGAVCSGWHVPTGSALPCVRCVRCRQRLGGAFGVGSLVKRPLVPLEQRWSAAALPRSRGCSPRKDPLASLPGRPAAPAPPRTCGPETWESWAKGRCVYQAGWEGSQRQLPSLESPPVRSTRLASCPPEAALSAGLLVV